MTEDRRNERGETLPLRPTRRDLGRASVAIAIASSGHFAAPAQASSADVDLASGEHRIDNDCVIRGTLTLHAGARLKIGSSAKLTLLGDLIAPSAPIFSGDGKVDLTHSHVFAARPEWWGAVADDAAVDCAPAIEASLAAHIAVELGLGDYHLQRTLVVDRPNRRLRGIGRTKGSRGTRLLLVGGEGAVMRIGSETAPALVNDYLWGIDMRWLELGRSAAPQARATGLQVRYVTDCVLEGLRANEHAIGFSLRGAVRTLVRDCAAFRSQFADSAGDPFVGFDLDGADPPLATGANASLYLIDCMTNAARPPAANAVGCRVVGAFSDTFLVRFETNQLTDGIVIDGLTKHGRYAQLNLHLDTPVLDQCARAGITIRNLGETAMIDISSPWIAVPAGAEAALSIARTGGAISVVGGQIVATGGGASVGLSLDQASGITLVGTKFLDIQRPVVAREITGFDLAFVVLASPVTGDAVLALENCTQGAVRVRLLGMRGKFATGVTMNEACHGILIETSGLHAATAPARLGKATPRAWAGLIAVP